MTGISPGREEWISCHIHYHGDQNLLLREAVAPGLRSLLASRLIDRFFYVRYALGGPHIRLRCRPVPGTDVREVEGVIAAGARAFFARRPSTSSWTEEEIRRRNRNILAHDPAEQDDAAYPDESWRSAPFRAETERYGGPRLLAASLEVFTLASVAALEILARSATAPGRRFSAGFRFLGRQAWRITASPAELLSLLARLARAAGDAFPDSTALAHRRFQERPEAFTQLLEQAVAGATGKLDWTEGAAWLRCRLSGTPPEKREAIAASHLHMSANRLGLANAEEAYLYPALYQTCLALSRTGGGLWRQIEADFDRRRAEDLPQYHRIDEIVTAALNAFRAEDLEND